MLDLKIVNAKVPDFDIDNFIETDISIKDGKIVKLGQDHEDYKEIIDAKGQIVSPGFVDIHAHEDFIDGDRYHAANYALNMGVTTNIAGNCGLNKQSFESFVGYIEENGCPTNYAMMIGNQSLRKMAGMTEGERYRAATKKEISDMQKIIRDHLKYGILGISYGLEYTPGITLEEAVDLTKGLDDRDYLLAAHYRCDADESVDSIKEMAEISKLTNRPMQVSHIGSCAAMGYMGEALDTMEGFIKEGVDLMADCYPYDAFCTKIGSAVFDDGCFDRWNKTYSDILLTAGDYKGKRCDKKLFYEAREKHPDMAAVAFVMNDEEVELAFTSPYCMVASDSLFFGDDGHPRGAGTYPRVIARYVREKKTLTLIEALRKMTVMPAHRSRLFNKGEIKEGKDADIVIFDCNKVVDKADYLEPTLAPEGINHVIINGEAAIKNGILINDRIGKYIYI